MLSWDPILSDKRERSRRIQQTEEAKNEVIRGLAALETPDEAILLSQLKEDQPNLYAMIFRKKMLNGPSWCLLCNVGYRFYDEMLQTDARVDEVPDGLKDLFKRADSFAGRYACGRCKGMNSIAKPKYTQEQVEEMFFSAGLKDDVFSTVKQAKKAHSDESARQSTGQSTQTKQRPRKTEEQPRKTEEQGNIFEFCEIMIKRMETLGRLFLESANDYRRELESYKQNIISDQQAKIERQDQSLYFDPQDDQPSEDTPTNAISADTLLD